MFFPLSIVTLVLALVALGTPVKRDFIVAWDIDELEAATDLLEATIKALPAGGSITQASTIHQAALRCESLTRTAEDDTDKFPEFTDDQADDINNALAPLVTSIQAVSNTLIEMQSAIIASYAELMAEEDIKTLHSDAKEFESALLERCPESAQSQMQAYIDLIEAAFDAVAEAYGVSI